MAKEIGEEPKLVYALTIVYENGLLETKNIRLIEGSAPDRINQPGTGYELRLISNDESILYSFKFLIETEPAFDPPIDIFDENGNQIIIPETPITTIKSTELVLVIPYFSEAKSIDIYDETKQIVLSVDVSKYGKKSQGVDGLIDGNDPIIDNSMIYLMVGLIMVVIIGTGVFIAYKKGLFSREAKVKTKKKKTKNN